MHNELSSAKPDQAHKAPLFVVGPAWVGDMVMAQSAFQHLKRTFAGADLHVLAPAWTHPLLARMPEVNQTWALPLGHGDFAPYTRWRLGQRLRAYAFQQAWVLPRSWKAALVPWAAGIPRRTGFLGEHRYGLLNDIRALDKSRLDQTVKRFVSLVHPKEAPELHISQPQLTINSDQQAQSLARLQLNLERPCLALLPGAEYGPAKQWPSAYFRHIAQEAVATGYQVWVLGSAKEAPLGQAICAQLPQAYNLCGQTQLTECIDLLALCEQAISNDSGLMHVAAAVGLVVHAIYGSSSPQYTPPLTEKAHIYWQALSCAPCFKRQCPLGHTQCLHLITPEQVWQQVQAVSSTLIT